VCLPGAACAVRVLHWYAASVSERLDADSLLVQLPRLADSAGYEVLALYEAICQAKRLGATFDQLVSASGLSRGNVQRVVNGELPKFGVKRR
jgi:hypothetical protein